MSRSRSREKEAASTTTASEQREEATARAGHAVKGATRARARQATGAVSRIATMQAHQHAVGGAAKSQFTPGMLVVKCKEDVVANVPEIQTASVASIRSFSLPKSVEDPFQNLAQQQLIREIVPIFSRSTRGRALSVAPRSVAAAFAMSVRDSENEDLRGLSMLRLEPTADLKKIEQELASTPGIEYVHRVPRRWIAAPRPLPRDPLAPSQWGLRSIKWFNLDPKLDASGVKVAVLDTGVDITHPDLKNIVRTYIHDGAVGDDIIGHGTHVAGIISAEMNNKVGITGVCQCDLSVWKIFDDTPDPFDGEYYVDDVMYQRALNAARNSGMRVVNLSIGGTFHSQTEEFLFRRLVAAGATVVAAMGNEFKKGNPTEYPAAYPGVVAVGATGKTNRRAAFSNTGKHISLVAPGINILSTLPMAASAARSAVETKYAFWEGTSMATPHVAAAAALMLAKDPNLSPAQVGARLGSSATALSAMGGKAFTNEYGHGLLNIEGAVS